MKRVLALALIAALGHASVAAAEGLLDSARRAARDVDATLASRGAAAASWTRSEAGRTAMQGSSLTSSGLSRRTKVLIILAVGVGVAVTAYAIDRKVEDPTPSSRGER